MVFDEPSYHGQNFTACPDIYSAYARSYKPIYGRNMTMNIFSSYNLGNAELQNRIVMAPMTRSRCPGNVPNSLVAEYYGQRSSAGLIITEGTSPSPNGLGYARIPGIFSKEQTDSWRLITEAVLSLIHI